MNWDKIWDAIKHAATRPEWWSAATGILGLLIATFAFLAAWRAARAAMAAYRTQTQQLVEMESQTQSMQDQVSAAREQLAEEKMNGISIWLAPHEEDEGADIRYVNTSGHPVYNIALEITDISDKYMKIPVLEPTTQPTTIKQATEYFAEELSFIGDLRRPGICFQFDTWEGVRYVRDHGGSVISAGGNPLYTRPHRKWLPDFLR